MFTYVRYFITGQEIGSEKYGCDFIKNTISGFFLGGAIAALAVGAVPLFIAFVVSALVIVVMFSAVLLLSESILTEIEVSSDLGGNIYGSPSASLSIEPDGGIDLGVDLSYGMTTSLDQAYKPDLTIAATFYPFYTDADEVGKSISVGVSVPIGPGNIGVDLLFSPEDDGNNRNGFEGISVTYTPKASLPECHIESNLPISYSKSFELN